MKKKARLIIVICLIIAAIIAAIVYVTRNRNSYDGYIDNDITEGNVPDDGWDESGLEHKVIIIDGVEYEVNVNN